jgi:sugar lactone lactonase YvrE
VNDAAATVYITEFSRRVRKLTPGGVVTTLAGSATESGYVDDVGAAARFSGQLLGVAVLPGGDLLVSDAANQRFRRVTPQGVVTTYATTPVNAPQTAYGLAADASGNVYCVFFNGVAKIDAAAGHAITTVAGGGGGYADGQGAAARFEKPAGIAFNSDGDLLVADLYNHAIRKVTLAGAVTTFAGKGIVTGSADGTGTAAAFNLASGLGVDGSGFVYVADSGNSTMRKIAAGGVVTTWAGTGINASSDGQGLAAQFSGPTGLAAQTDGTLYVTDRGSGLVRMITPQAAVSTLPPMLNSAGFVALAPAGGALALTDQNHHLILAISPGGVLSTVAGADGVSGADDGTGTAATFNFPGGVAVDAAGTIYVADSGNNKIRKITMPGGVVTTLAGGGFGLTDGVGAEARFNTPRGVAVDPAGNVYVADNGNYAIRKVTPTGRVITVGGNGQEGSAVGEDRAATFNRPDYIAVAPDGTLYVSDLNQRIVRGLDNSSEPPILTAPLANSAMSNAVTVTYELTEAALIGSVMVKFTPPSGSPVTLTLTAAYSTQGLHTLTFNPAAPLASAPAAIGAISGGTSVPDAIHTLTLSYRDARLNPEVSATVTGVKIDTITLPPTFTAPAANASVGRLTTLRMTLPEKPGSVTVSFGGGVTLTLDPAQFSAGVQKLVTFDPADPVNSGGGLITSGDPIAEGTYAVTLSYSDYLQNPAAMVTHTGVRVDTTAPTFVLPPDGVPVQRAAAGTLPDFTALLSTTDATAVTVTQSPLASAVTTYTGQPITVTLTATDAAGNSTTYDLAVDVRPADPLNTVVFTASTKAAIPGGPVPGAGTFTGLPAGATFTSLGVPAIDNLGKLAFTGKWAGPNKTKGMGIFTDTKCVALIGGAAPGGGTYKTLSDPVAANGSVAFIATLTGVPAPQKTAIFSDAPTGTLENIAQTGIDAEIGGATFKAFKGVQILGNIVGFFAQVTGGSGADKITAANDLGLWVKNGPDPLEAILREGDVVDSNTTPEKKIKTLSSFSVGAGSPGQGRGWLGDPYGAVMLAHTLLDDKAKTQALIGAGNYNLYSQSGSTDRGVPALTGATFQTYGFPATNASTYGLTFLGTLTPGTPASVTKANNKGVFFTPHVLSNPTLDALARLTDSVTDSNGVTGTITALKDPVLADDGAVAYAATLKGAAIKAASANTLWWKPAGENTASILAQGGHVASNGPQYLGVPGVGSAAQFKTFNSLAIAATRGPLFTATLATGKTVGNVTAPQANGLWAIDFEGKLRQVFQTGLPLNGGKTLKSFTVLTAVPGSIGVTRSFNDAAQVTWLATFTDGTTAIVKTVIP